MAGLSGRGTMRAPSSSTPSDVVHAVAGAGAMKAGTFDTLIKEEPVEVSSWQCAAMTMTNLVQNGTKP